MQKAIISNRVSQLRIRHLALLEHIETLGSLSAVAEALSLTQPSITSMLQDLELAFQTTLVDRDRQGARLTATGKIALTRLRVALSSLSVLEKDLHGPTNRRHLRVGVLSNAMLQLVPRAIATLHERGFDITFEFLELTVDGIISGLLDTSLDCAIGRIGAGAISPVEQAELSIQPLRSDPMIIVGSPSHPLSTKRHVTLTNLQKERWVLLPSGSQSRLAFDQAFIQEGLAPPVPLVESLSFYSNFHLVNQTLLLTTAPASTLSYLAEANLVSVISYRWPIRLSPLMFFSLKSLQGHPPTEAFRKAIFQHANVNQPKK